MTSRLLINKSRSYLSENISRSTFSNYLSPGETLIIMGSRGITFDFKLIELLLDLRVHASLHKFTQVYVEKSV